MDFKQLKTFTEVVQQQSFTKAAEKLHISQPTISTHIAQLEEELHTKLLIRTTKALEITPKGHELYGYALNILELKERMLQACSVESQKIIHLGASTIPSAYILPQLLPEFGQKYPDIYFVIHQNDSQGVIDGLANGIFNLGFLGMAINQEDIVCEPFCQDHMVIITPINDHYLSYKKASKLPLDSLLKEPIILREKGSGSKKTADSFLESCHLEEKDLNITARVNDQEAIKNLVAGGLGISIISSRAAANFAAEKRVLVFELPSYMSQRNLYLIYRKNYLLPGYVKDFIRFIKSKNL